MEIIFCRQLGTMGNYNRISIYILRVSRYWCILQRAADCILWSRRLLAPALSTLLEVIPIAMKILFFIDIMNTTKKKKQKKILDQSLNWKKYQLLTIRWCQGITGNGLPISCVLQNEKRRFCSTITHIVKKIKIIQRKNYYIFHNA